LAPVPAKLIEQLETGLKCPALIPEARSGSSEESDSTSIYEHCKKCLTGVFIAHEKDDVRCTFCGELKETDK
jgi:ribosomal protein S27AE